jgi:hypothetical protein
MKTFTICKSQAVPFSLKWKRLTLQSNPPIYHWLWFTFSFYDHSLYKGGK